MSLPARPLHDLMNEILNVRRFRADQVPGEVQEAMLEAFRLGPSAANIQPWELVTVEGEDCRAAVAAATLDPFLSAGSEGAQSWLLAAPFVVTVCLDQPRAQARLGEIGWEQSAQDAFAAIQNLRLIAAAHGLRTAVVREFSLPRLQEALSLPFTVKPLALVAAGYSDAAPEYPPRLPLAKILHRDGWSA